MSFLLGYAQDVGSRDRQEDYLAEKQIGNMHLAVLADGMGGHEGGDQASDIVTQGFIRYVEQQAHRYPQIADLLLDAVFSANSHLAQIKRNPASNMGSTVVALLARETHAWWISVGDSLLYLWRNNQLQKLNVKHSHYQDLRQKVFLGEISSRQASSDPQRDGLTSALAGREIKYVDVSRFGIDLQPGDKFILASDGLETLSAEQIIAILQKSSNPQQIADGLVRHVKLAGNPQQDNVSIIVIEAAVQQSTNLKVGTRTIVKKSKFSSPLVFALGGLLIGGVLGFGSGMSLSPQEGPLKGKETISQKDKKNPSLSPDISNKCSDEAKRAVETCQQVFTGKDKSLQLCPNFDEEAKKRCENSHARSSQQTESNDSAAPGLPNQTNTAQPIPTTVVSGNITSSSVSPGATNPEVAPANQRLQVENNRTFESGVHSKPNNQAGKPSQQILPNPAVDADATRSKGSSSEGVKP